MSRCGCIRLCVKSSDVQDIKQEMSKQCIKQDIVDQDVFACDERVNESTERNHRRTRKYI
jgi:ribosomal protein L19E